MSIFKKMGIVRPYLVGSLLCLSAVLGGISVYVYHGIDKKAMVAKYETLREEKEELRHELTKTVAEYEKKMKQIKKQTEKRPDGTVIITETDTESEESGKTETTGTLLYQGKSYKLIEREFTWSSGYSFNADVYPKIGLTSGLQGFSGSIRKEVLWGLSIGPVVTYMDDKWYFGLSVGVNF